MISLDLQSRVPIYEQLVGRISELVALGALAPDEQLPSVRSVARELGVNPNTVQKAYQELERRGVLYSVAGRGSFIAPGDLAGEELRRRGKQKLRETLEETKRMGLVRADAEEAVQMVYEGEEHHD